MGVVLKVLGLCAAVAMVGLGIWSLIVNLSHFNLEVWAKCIWLTLFGLLLIVAETRQYAASQWVIDKLQMEFLMTFFGRGLFAFYVGTICLGDKTLANREFVGWLIGAILCAVGVVNLSYSCTGADKDGNKEGYEADNRAILNP